MITSFREKRAALEEQAKEKDTGTTTNTSGESAHVGTSPEEKLKTETDEKQKEVKAA